MKAANLIESIDQVLNSGQTVVTLESLANPKNKEEIIVTAAKILGGWVGGAAGDWVHGKPDTEFTKSVVNTSMFLFLKRNVPGCIYKGKAYRVVWLGDIEFFMAERPEGEFEEYFNDLSKFTVPKVRYMLQHCTDYLSRLNSWTKSKEVLEILVERLKPLYKSIQIIIVDNIVGIDIMEVALFLEREFKDEKNNFTKAFVRKYKSRISKLILQSTYIHTEKEIVAPFNPKSFQVVSLEKIKGKR